MILILSDRNVPTAGQFVLRDIALLAQRVQTGANDRGVHGLPLCASPERPYYIIAIQLNARNYNVSRSGSQNRFSPAGFI